MKPNNVINYMITPCIYLFFIIPNINLLHWFTVFNAKTIMNCLYIINIYILNYFYNFFMNKLFLLIYLKCTSDDYSSI